MKKTMRKVMGVVLAASMIIGSAVTTFAADSGKLYAVDMEHNTGNNDVQRVTDTEPKGVIGLGIKRGDDLLPVDDVHITFPVEVDTAGEYEVKVHYSSGSEKAGQERKADIVVNGDRSSLPIEITGDWDTYKDAVVTVTLNAGKNEIKLMNDKACDDTTVKSINVEYIEWKLTKADEQQPDNGNQGTGTPDNDNQSTEAPDEGNQGTETPDSGNQGTEAPDNSNQGTETPSVSTGDATTAGMLVVMAGAAAAFVVMTVDRKKREQ